MSAGNLILISLTLRIKNIYIFGYTTSHYHISEHWQRSNHSDWLNPYRYRGTNSSGLRDRDRVPNELTSNILLLLLFIHCLTSDSDPCRAYADYTLYTCGEKTLWDNPVFYLSTFRPRLRVACESPASRLWSSVSLLSIFLVTNAAVVSPRTR